MRSSDTTVFLNGIEQFNRGEFFAAHETWEAVWLEAEGQDRFFLQGIIQVAAAFHHWDKGNPIGARSLLRRGMEKLGGFPRSYRGICVDRLREQSGKWMEALGGEPIKPPNALPKIELESGPLSGDGA